MLLLLAIASYIAAAFPETAASMLYIFSFWILLAREISSVLPETVRETDETSSEILLMLDLVS